VTRTDSAPRVSLCNGGPLEGRGVLETVRTMPPASRAVGRAPVGRGLARIPGWPGDDYGNNL
jgi:hypothetical protein